MRKVLLVALLATTGSVFADPAATITGPAPTSLPPAASLGISQLPIKNAAVFQLSLRGIAILRADQPTATFIDAKRTFGDPDAPIVEFEIPNGKALVLTELQIPSSDSVWGFFIAQLAGKDPSLGDFGGAIWTLYSALVKQDLSEGIEKKLSTPLVLTPGKTYFYTLKETSQGIGVDARGYFLDH